MRRALVITLFVTLTACGAPAVHVVVAPPERLADDATSAFEDELRAIGFRIESTTPGDKSMIEVSRATARWTLALGVESATDERGPKWVVRVTVFREPGRELKGEIAPNAIAPGTTLDAGTRRALVQALGKRAADQFAENFE